MAVSIKQEPGFDDFSMLSESQMCCFLCQEGQKVFRALVEHFKEKHREDYNNLPNDSIVQLCSCPDAIQLQFQLMNHMLTKALPRVPVELQLKEEEENFSVFTEDISENVKVELGKDDEAYCDEDNDSSPSFEERSKYKRPRGRPRLSESKHDKRKRRKRFELEEAEGYTVKCDHCPRVFTKFQSLQNHYDLMHDPVNQFKCSKCDTGHCKTLRNLNSHMRTHEEEEVRASMNDSESKICPKCGKAWETDLQLYHHMMTHREKLLQCDHCDMRFNMKNTLWRHILTHFKKKEPKEQPKEKKTLCQYCSMWISFYNLKRHIRTSHSENKHIYKCDFEGCGKSFTESQTLKDHKNLHLGLKPYVCEFCSMAFPHIATLRRHKYRHTDPEKYKCEICQECFVTRKSLTNHVQRQHHDVGNDAKPFACDFEGCFSTFKYENYLQNHKRDVHIRKRSRIRNKEKQVAHTTPPRFFNYNETSM